MGRPRSDRFFESVIEALNQSTGVRRAAADATEGRTAAPRPRVWRAVAGQLKLKTEAVNFNCEP
jgi:hypothetical protein